MVHPCELGCSKKLVHNNGSLFMVHDYEFGTDIISSSLIRPRIMVHDNTIVQKEFLVHVYGSLFPVAQIYLYGLKSLRLGGSGPLVWTIDQKISPTFGQFFS